MNNGYFFKGKRKDNGEWIKGYYVYEPQEDRHIIYYYNEHPCGHCIVPYEVYPSTVENLEIKQYLDEIKVLKERVYKLESKLSKAERCMLDIGYAVKEYNRN